MRARLARLRWGRLGLRSRITLTFTLGAFILSVLLAGTAYLLTRAALVRQSDQAAVDQAFSDARTVLDALASNPPSAQPALEQLGSTGAANPLVFYRGEWAARSAEFGPDALPAALVVRVGDDQVASRMTYPLRGRPVLAVGVPLPEVPATYYEVVELQDLEGTLRSVAFSLMGAAAITTALGVLLGAFAARRAVRPLADAAQAAKAIAGGRLDTRLEDTDDRDLGAVSEAFNDMATALQQRVERDARFASDVSHELRSPLMTLAASAQVLQARRDEMPERAQAALDLLVADVARFQGLVEDLLEISRFDAGAVRLHREDLLVAEFVRQAVSVSSLRETPVHVTPTAEHLLISGDKRRLARAVANLIDNARLHGGGDVEISVQEGEAADGQPVDQVLIAVEDHGPGVPPEERALVFERFARGGSAGRRGSTDGAGLGLALVDEHVRLHGGRVWVEDRADGASGARFVIELPAEDA